MRARPQIRKHPQMPEIRKLGGHHLNRMIPESRWPMLEIPTAPPTLRPMLRSALHRIRQRRRSIPLRPATQRRPTAQRIPVLLQMKRMQATQRIPALLPVQRVQILRRTPEFLLVQRIQTRQFPAQQTPAQLPAQRRAM